MSRNRRSTMPSRSSSSTSPSRSARLQRPRETAAITPAARPESIGVLRVHKVAARRPVRRGRRARDRVGAHRRAARAGRLRLARPRPRPRVRIPHAPAQGAARHAARRLARASLAEMSRDWPRLAEIGRGGRGRAVGPGCEMRVRASRLALEISASCRLPRNTPPALPPHAATHTPRRAAAHTHRPPHRFRDRASPPDPARASLRRRRSSSRCCSALRCSPSPSRSGAACRASWRSSSAPWRCGTTRTTT